MLHFDLYQFTDSGAGGYQKTDNKVPEVMMLCLQLRLESFTVLVCDDGILEGVPGNLYRAKTEAGEIRGELRLFFFQKK